MYSNYMESEGMESNTNLIDFSFHIDINICHYQSDEENENEEYLPEGEEEEDLTDDDFDSQDEEEEAVHEVHHRNKQKLLLYVMFSTYVCLKACIFLNV